MSSINLETISEEKLLKTRIADLPITIQNTWIEDCIAELYRELDTKNIKFKPECYLADEWLTPDREPVIGIPFYLAHPTLMRLEKKMMLEAEGGTKESCMKLLRHETGHAINYAYRFYRQKKWKKIFGSMSKEYKDTYRFRPYSRKYVRHLEKFYAQCHPDEDYAETFAVWLNPDIDWREQYKGWQALEKLKYVDQCMSKYGVCMPRILKGKRYWQASNMRLQIQNYYKRKRHLYAEDFPDFHDRNLQNVFKVPSENHHGFSLVAPLLRKHRKDINNSVYKWTGEKKYIIDDLVRKTIKRAATLKLLTPHSESMTIMYFSTYIVSLIMNYMYTGRLRGEA